ncbi:MAG TPA: glycosyltransferase [Planctomycetaceae bacterium]|nr:glycosyltransferase [Planctomycetaceae bacterium]
MSTGDTVKDTTGIAVGIVTCNREASLERCLRSLARLGPLVREVIVVDNGSERPLTDWLPEGVPGLTCPLRTFRLTGYHGPIAARNRIAEAATCEFLLSLDDDAEILESVPVVDALDLMTADDSIGAIAFAQATGEGVAWPPQTQAAPVDYPCITTAFIGCAALLKRSSFLELGGYCETLDFYGEEKEFCLRLMHSGRTVVYLPEARVAHLADPGGRDPVKYYRYYTRNDCFTALRNYPFPLALYFIAQRFLFYHRTARRHMQMSDPSGRRWLCGQLYQNWGTLWRQRRSVGWRTINRWRGIKRDWPAYSTKSAAVQPDGCSQCVTPMDVERN